MRNGPHSILSKKRQPVVLSTYEVRSPFSKQGHRTMKKFARRRGESGATKTVASACRDSRDSVEESCNNTGEVKGKREKKKVVRHGETNVKRSTCPNPHLKRGTGTQSFREWKRYSTKNRVSRPALEGRYRWVTPCKGNAL